MRSIMQDLNSQQVFGPLDHWLKDMYEAEVRAASYRKWVDVL